MTDAVTLTAERGAVYGHPKANFGRTAKMWEAIIGAPVTPEQVALCMVALKLARLVESPQHRDSQDDINGYVRTLQMLAE